MIVQYKLPAHVAPDQSIIVDTDAMSVELVQTITDPEHLALLSRLLPLATPVSSSLSAAAAADLVSAVALSRRESRPHLRLLQTG